MNFRMLIKHMPNLWATKDLISYLALTAILGVLCFLLLGKVAIAYSDSIDIQNKTVEMTSFVDDWQQKELELQKAVYRPVLKAEIDEIQSNILLLLAAHNLDMASFRNIQAQKNANGLTYEMNIKGTWSSLVNFLRDFHVKDALISVQRMKIDPDQSQRGNVHAVLQYKIYLK